MTDPVEQRLSRLIQLGGERLLQGSSIGMEKESLRVSPEGNLAQTPHPAALGAPLTNPYITTDYSEALLELITPPCADAPQALDFLRDIHRFVYAHLDDEYLWSTSMPCVVAGETSIPLARYGSSNAGTMKTVYRRGLGHRYGRVMQVIAGVHFNFSLPEPFWPAWQAMIGDAGALRDARDAAYFALIRNLTRYGWLIPYLFGASPAVCKSFLHGRTTTLDEFDEGTFYEPFATSLRMGDIGYQNNKENEVGVKACYDSLGAYIDSLTHAINTPWPAYAKIGVNVNGRYEQLNANLLQIENEYYSTVRPKQVPERNEKPTLALQRRGVRYIELRSLDVNVFDPLGIDLTQSRFLETFLIYCLLADSPVIDAQERREIDSNEITTAHRGRDPSLQLWRHGREVGLRDWALELCDGMQAVSDLLDAGHADRPYAASLAAQCEAIRDPDRTPSARMLAEMSERQEGFHVFARRLSRAHQESLQATPLDAERAAFFAAAAQSSLQRQRDIEAADAISFDEYLERYFSQA